MAFILTSSRMVDARDFDGPRLSRRARGKPAQRLARQIDRPGNADQVARTRIGQRGGQRLGGMIDRANIERGCGLAYDRGKLLRLGAAMPDTGTGRGPDARMTAPDAGVTGTVPEKGEPAVAPTPPEGTAGGATGQIAPTTDQIPPKR